VIAVIAAIGSASWFLLQRHSTTPLLSMFRFRAIPAISAISAIFLETLFLELSIHLLHRRLPRRRGGAENCLSIYIPHNNAASLAGRENDRCSVL
jgi:hypothetical protein